MSPAKPNLELQIEVAQTADQVLLAFEPMRQAFGFQTRDAVFTGTNPDWDTPAGAQQAAERFATRFTRATTNAAGKPNSLFLVATVADPATRRRVVAGMALWEQASVVPGHGDAPTADEGEDLGVTALFPGDAPRQAYWTAVMGAMHRRRWEVVGSKAAACPPALLALDLCAVDPRFQGRGIGSRLVEWGLREAEARGGLEAVTEASVMGRPVYLKLGFEQDGPEMDFAGVGEVGKTPLPSLVFLRTRKP
ncbi:GCN5-related N-acetyltransferase [Cordyceps militaris CM01]|uniref:GCN5-related N-acetyltransferase n=1 Tax=Cordyceps militaris (strain CM01) TaxID=983644 RepID=G3JTV4_CORMM|nr:GCN5-related N-acetyltransferase [Cordyceps militaris CM01]EGX88108.1 GCN5-related N-acetyltransferase [Cordyceps militaris CM01]